MKYGKLLLVAAILTLPAGSFAEQKIPSLDDAYKLTLGDVICIEISSTLQSLSAKADVFGMILSSYDAEAKRIRIEVYGKRGQSKAKIEKSKAKIEAIKKLLDVFLIPRANERHGTVLSETDFAISILAAGKPVLVFEDGKYVLGD